MCLEENRVIKKWQILELGYLKNFITQGFNTSIHCMISRGRCLR